MRGARGVLQLPCIVFFLLDLLRALSAEPLGAQ